MCRPIAVKSILDKKDCADCQPLFIALTTPFIALDTALFNELNIVTTVFLIVLTALDTADVIALQALVITDLTADIALDTAERTALKPLVTTDLIALMALETTLLIAPQAAATARRISSCEHELRA